MGWDGTTVNGWSEVLDGCDVVINPAVSTRAVGQAISLAKASSSYLVAGRHRNDLFTSLRCAKRRNIGGHRWRRTRRTIDLALQHRRRTRMGAIFIRTETELILKSRRVIPGRLLDLGFTFKHPLWSEAAEDLCGQWKLERKQ